MQLKAPTVQHVVTAFGSPGGLYVMCCGQPRRRSAPAEGQTLEEMDTAMYRNVLICFREFKPGNGHALSVVSYQ